MRENSIHTQKPETGKTSIYPAIFRSLVDGQEVLAFDRDSGVTINSTSTRGVGYVSDNWQAFDNSEGHNWEFVTKVVIHLKHIP